LANRPFIIALLLLLIFFCSCDNSGKIKKEKKGQKIVYRLKWLFNASTAGDLWAKEKGIFQKKGLNVILKEGGAEQDAIEEIELGRASFGVASSDQVLRAVSKGADVLVLAQIFQINPLQWIFIKERTKINKEHPAEDLKRLTIGITYGGNDEAIFFALARRLGLDHEKLNIYAITYDYTPFWQGKVNLWPCYRNTQGIFLSKKIQAMGEEPDFFDPSKYGINFVANSLITSKKFAKAHPKLIEKFKDAVLEGWKQALNKKNINELAHMLQKYDKALPIETIKEQIKETRKLVAPYGLEQIGVIQRNAWLETEKEMYRQRLIKKHVNIDTILQTKGEDKWQ